MYEIGLASKLIDEAIRQNENVKELKLEVGELAEVDAADLEKALKQMVDWKVDVEPKKSKVKCECGYSGEARIVERGNGYCIYNCPKCGHKPFILEGGDIRILSLK